MLQEIVRRRDFFILLHRIDEDLAQESRQKSCPHCQARLDQANYARKPRGETESLPQECMLRFSNCCSREGCRRRVLPPSVKFLGRKIYWACINLVAICLRQWRPRGWTARKVMMTLGIPEKTLSRWARYWREVFPATRQWQHLRGRVPVEVRDSDLPRALVASFLRQDATEQESLLRCLRFLVTG